MGQYSTNAGGPTVAIPVTNATGHMTYLQGRVRRPTGDAPARIVATDHGSHVDNNLSDLSERMIAVLG